MTDKVPSWKSRPRNELQALKRMKKILSSKERWAQRELALTKYRIAVYAHDPLAASFCLRGTMLRAQPANDLFLQVDRRLQKHTGGNRCPVQFNDARDTTFEDIQNLLDKAIKEVSQ